MRQVPSYLLIGSGRVARHFQRYLSLLQLSFQSWSRQANYDLETYQKIPFILSQENPDLSFKITVAHQPS